MERLNCSGKSQFARQRAGIHMDIDRRQEQSYQANHPQHTLSDIADIVCRCAVWMPVSFCCRRRRRLYFMLLNCAVHNNSLLSKRMNSLPFTGAALSFYMITTCLVRSTPLLFFFPATTIVSPSFRCGNWVGEIPSPVCLMTVVLPPIATATG